MSEEKVWALLARKLADEASASELKELKALVDDDPELSYQVEIILHFWNTQVTRLPDKTAFQKLLAKIESIQSTENK